jgi:DNA-binding transcriptional MerR regulator
VDKAPDAFRTISEVAADLDVPQHVLRFWESRFREIKPMKRGGGRRYYRPDDVALLRGIRYLLYGEGYTIRGVQRILKDQGPKFVQSVWLPDAPKPASRPAQEADFAADDVDPQHQEEADRSRGLLRLLPSLLGSNDEDEAAQGDLSAMQQELPPLPARPVPPVLTPRGIPREDVRKLEDALEELAECRKMIDAVLTEEP